MSRQRQSAGFTLIELMIVVAVIAIPAYQDYLIRAQVTEGLSLAGGAKAAEWDFVSNTGRFPQANESAGLPSSTSITGTYVSELNLAPAGKITVSFNTTKANASIKSSTLVLSAITHSGSITWTCSGGTLAGKYLPSSCRP